MPVCACWTRRVGEPWAEKQKKFWEKPVFGFAAAGLAIAALIACAVLAMQISSA
jgi:hypothetical protein